MASIKDNASRSMLCQNWQEDGGVLIMSYSLFLNLSDEKKKTVKKEKWRQTFRKTLLDPGNFR